MIRGRHYQHMLAPQREKGEKNLAGSSIAQASAGSATAWLRSLFKHLINNLPARNTIMISRYFKDWWATFPFRGGQAVLLSERLVQGCTWPTRPHKTRDPGGTCSSRHTKLYFISLNTCEDRSLLQWFRATRFGYLRTNSTATFSSLIFARVPVSWWPFHFALYVDFVRLRVLVCDGWTYNMYIHVKLSFSLLSCTSISRFSFLLSNVFCFIRFVRVHLLRFSSLYHFFSFPFSILYFCSLGFLAFLLLFSLFHCPPLLHFTFANSCSVWIWNFFLCIPKPR